MKTTINILIIIGFMFLFSSCFPVVDCETYNQSIKIDKFNLILQKKKNEGKTIVLKGYNPETKETQVYSINTAEIYDYHEFIELGDMLIKNQNEMSYKILKESKIYTVEIKCESIKVETFNRY